MVLPVHLEGVVCWIDPTRTLIALQDEGRIAFLEIDLVRESVNAGDKVAIEGPCLVKPGRFNLRRPPVVDNDGAHGMREKTGRIFLPRGKHPLEVIWFNKGGAGGLEVEYEGPNLDRQSIPGSALFHCEPDQGPGATNYLPGLTYRAYEGDWDVLPDFDQLAPVRRGVVDGFELQSATRTNQVGLAFNGLLDAPTDGLYTFYLRSDDGSRITFDEVPATISVRGTNSFPPPRPVRPGQPFALGDRQWCEVEGRAEFLYERPQGLMVEVVSSQGRMIAALPVTPRISRALLAGAQVRLRGVCQGLYNTDEKPIAARILVPSPEMVDVLAVPQAQWAGTPVSGIPTVERFSDDHPGTVLHVRGRIARVADTRNFTLQVGSEVIDVQTLQPLTLEAEAEVETIGLFGHTSARAVLVSALWRDAAAEPKPEQGKLPCLTTIEQVHRLKKEEAERHYPVRVRGVVTYVRLGTADGILQDGTRGVYVQNLAPPDYVPLDIGDYLEVEANTVAGDFAPKLDATRVEYLGRGQLPTPIRPTWDQLMSGSADCQYVELEGVITAVRETSVQFLVRGGHLEVEVPGHELAELARRENARVLLRGCLFAKWHPDTGQVDAGSIGLGGITDHVLKPAATNLFACASKQIAELGQFDARAGALQRVRVSGQVLFSQGGLQYLTDGTNSLRFSLKTPAPVQVGDVVEVAGFPEFGGPSPLLRHAVLRKTGHAPLPLARELKAEELLDGVEDGTLVRLKGSLVSLHVRPTEQLLEVQAGPRNFIARLATRAAALQPIPIGSRLSLEGVYARQSSLGTLGEGNNNAFELLLNAPENVRILAHPAWWTPQRTLVFILALTGILGLTITWSLALRRQVNRRTKQLRQEIEERKETEAKLQAEIVERKRMEQQVAKTHRDLMMASRVAGMAEIARSVLHNVGNVLNSATVSTSLLMQQIANSKLSKLVKVSDWIQEHEQDFPQFVARDTKGQQLPRYLIQLTKHLAEEQAQTMEELRSLAGNVEHIRQTVAMQQSYTGVSGVLEPVQLKEVIEDALRLGGGDLAQHAILLECEYDERVPETKVDRHTILQILVNLLENAKRACAESAGGEKRLAVKLARQGKCARIVVSDNGIGIAPGNLTRIFTYGFSTKQSGHAFGLHSSALAAKELGGALIAHSDGLGKGASFTLELPLVQSAEGIASATHGTRKAESI